MKWGAYLLITVAICAAVGGFVSMPWWMIPLVGVVVGTAVLAADALMQGDYDEGVSLLMLGVVVLSLMLATRFLP